MSKTEITLLTVDQMLKVELADFCQAYERGLQNVRGIIASDESFHFILIPIQLVVIISLPRTQLHKRSLINLRKLLTRLLKNTQPVGFSVHNCTYDKQTSFIAKKAMMRLLNQPISHILNDFIFTEKVT